MVDVPVYFERSGRQLLHEKYVLIARRSTKNYPIALMVRHECGAEYLDLDDREVID
jgi:hypothetical protein